MKPDSLLDSRAEKREREKKKGMVLILSISRRRKSRGCQCFCLYIHCLPKVNSTECKRISVEGSQNNNSPIATP